MKKLIFVVAGLALFLAASMYIANGLKSMMEQKFGTAFNPQERMINQIDR